MHHVRVLKNIHYLLRQASQNSQQIPQSCVEDIVVVVVLELYVQRPCPSQYGHGVLGLVRGLEQLRLVDIVRLERRGRAALNDVYYLVDRDARIFFRMGGPERAPLYFHGLGSQRVKEAQIVLDVRRLLSVRAEQVLWRQ